MKVKLSEFTTAFVLVYSVNDLDTFCVYRTDSEWVRLDVPHRPGKAIPDFYCDNAKALADLRAGAAEDPLPVENS